MNTKIYIGLIVLFLIVACQPVAEPTAIVKIENTAVPTISPTGTTTETAVSLPTSTAVPTPGATDTPTPKSDAGTIIGEVSNCDPDFEVDKITMPEIASDIALVLNDMNSFQYSGVYQFTSDGEYIPDQLAIELTGLYANQKLDSELWMSPISYHYDQSQTKLVDLHDGTQYETIEIDDLSWLKLPQQTMWIEMNSDKDNHEMPIHNLAEVLGPFYMITSLEFASDSFVGHVEKLSVDEEIMIHRCWRTDAVEDAPFLVIWHWDQLYTFLEQPEVHLWFNEDESQLLRIAIMGDQVLDVYFDWEMGLDEHDPPNQFLYDVELSDINESILIEPPNNAYVLIPTTEQTQESILIDETWQPPLPDDAVKISDPLREDVQEGDFSGLKPREFFGPGQSNAYFWMSDHVTPTWTELPYEYRPTYESNYDLQTLFYFFHDNLLDQGWQLESAEFELGRFAYYLAFVKDSQTLPIIIQKPMGKPTQILMFLSPNDEKTSWTIIDKEDSGISWGSSLLIDQSNQIWVDGRESIARFDGNIWTNFGDKNFTGNLALDKQGNIWGYGDHGLEMFDGEKWISIQDAENIKFENGLGDIAFDQSGRLWAIVNNDIYHIAVYDGTHWQFFTSKHFKDCKLSIVYGDSEGGVWFGASDYETEIVYHFDGANWFQIEDDQINSLEVEICDGVGCTEFQSCVLGDGVKEILEDSLGRVWIASYQNGLKYFDGQSWTFFKYESGEVPFQHPTAITFDQQDRMWVISDEGVLFMLDETGNWNSYFPPPDIRLGLYSELVVDEQGTVWINDGQIYQFSLKEP